MSWIIKPSADPKDQLYNRRLLAYYGLIYSAVWAVVIWVSWLVLESKHVDVSSAELAVLMGFPAALAGLGFFKYLEAAKIEQEATPPEVNEDETP